MFAATVLVAIAMLLLLRPWQRHGNERDASAREINTRIYRDQLAELDRDLAAGTLAAADHAQARDELQRRLLDDTAAPPEPVAPATSAGPATLLLALLLPLAAIGLYGLLGSPAALMAPAAPTAGAGSAEHQSSAAGVEQMVAALAARLQQNPADPKGWAMLARSYHAMGRMSEAKAAFERVGDDLQRDPLLLAGYADVLATLAEGNLEGQPLQLVMKALQLDPDHGMALSLAATAAYKRRDFAAATLYWERLLRQVPPGSEDAKWLQNMLAEIRAAQAPTGAAAAAPAVSPKAAPVTPATTTPAAGKAISGMLSLAPALQSRARPDDTVFIFARTVDGPRVPLAVQRARVADLPLRFQLDDSMAMNPQSKISDAKQVLVEARVSRQGSATPAAGDLIGASQPVAPGTGDMALTIDRVRP